MTRYRSPVPAKPELMSPAGYWPQLEAAVRAGADAVYFGLNHFSARAKVGFSLGELPDVIRSLHRNGVKGFVTFNTLVFDHELDQAKQAIVAIAESGADAIIVQDIGIAKLTHRIAPGLEVHGSTQMSITSAEGAELAASLGCSRVVLGRELNLKNIRAIANATDIELEVFVHGALCVSYSGQCFSSEAWGGRSANRGQCAQACRMSYDLVVDNRTHDLGESRYLLSPGDLYAIDQVPELIDIGVTCLKIEGRYKDENYVSLTTRAYRQAIDNAVHERLLQKPEFVSKNELEQIYSRGLGPHFLNGTNHQSVVRGRAPRHRGLRVGVVTAVNDQNVVVAADHQILPGDGLVFDSANWRSPDESEEGGNVFETVEMGGNTVELRFGREAIDFTRIRVGDLVWRTNDPRLNRKIRQSMLSQSSTTGIRFEVTTGVGQPLRLVGTTERNERVEIGGIQPLASAKSAALTVEMLRQQLGRLGGTPFHLDDVKLNSIEPVFCPVSQLNDMRRKLVSCLIEQRERISPQKTVPWKVDVDQTPSPEQDDSVKLHLLVRSPEQLEAAISCCPASITLDYLELYGLRPSMERIQAAQIMARVASPRILKPGEQKIVRFLLSLDCQILVRSGGLLHDLVTNFRASSASFPELFGDFSLNAANAIAFNEYLRMGLMRIAPSHDLNAQQIEDLSSLVPGERIEAIAFHHLPVFHTEHCVFCRFLSTGTDSSNCGHPCEKHRIALRDGSGRQHPVLADVGCRNTVFGAEAQTATRFLQSWSRSGIRNFRIEFVDQSSDEVLGISNAFIDFFDGKSDVSDLDNTLNRFTRQGTTQGSLYVPQAFRQLVQLT